MTVELDPLNQDEISRKDIICKVSEGSLWIYDLL